MFELWVATWCMVSPVTQSGMACKDQSFAISRSSAALLKDMVDYDVSEFWLYPMRDFEKYVVKVTVHQEPTITENP